MMSNRQDDNMMMHDEWNSTTTTNDPETDLLEILSSVSRYANNIAEDDKGVPSIPAVLWSCLTTSSTPEHCTNNDSWMQAVQRIRVLLDKLSAFDIHHVAMQSCSFGDTDKDTFSCLLLLLCVHALRQYDAGQKRPKRWRSLLCETIRLFQRRFLYNEEEEHSAPSNSLLTIDLWIHHVLPSCIELYQSLLPLINGIPLLAGMVGTSTRLLSQYISINASLSKQEQHDTLQLFYNAIGPVIQYRYAENLWCWPWSCYHASMSPQSSNADTDLVLHQTDLSWWTRDKDRHEESVAGMDTSWDPVGVALLAAYGFEDARPLVYTPAHVWHLWFPHVEVLLQAYPNDQWMGFELLSKLLSIMPRRVLSFKPKVPDSPIGTFQLVSSYVMAHASAKQQIQPTLQTVSSQMRLLLSKYVPCSQINIVKELVDKCPHSGFVPRLLDMLRPLVTDDACQEELWVYLATFVRELYGIAAAKGLSNAELLMEKLELYVSVVSMVQLRLMANNKDGILSSISQQQLQSIHQALGRVLEGWSHDENKAPPEFYRLYLLQDALQQVVRLLPPVTKRKLEETDCMETE